MSHAQPAVPPASPAAVELERALTRVAYLGARARQHDRLITVAGVPLDRAAVAMLRQIADHDPLRPGELAEVLAVQASHVTRQVQRLQKSGYVTRVADPDDSRARRIRLTPLGEDAVARLGEAGARGMQLVLADWSPGELRRLADLVHRLVDVFLAHPADEGHAFDTGTTTPTP
ncbi:MarR family transcriptional regulator [Streptomyces asoensis]|uniref:MarR family transcriptional regulator n=1 Tax=Streptomyces asoensis TaxID=249586 RepID=A0A6M4WG06_9ACTN|nr:MarR family transcriptional regulator [Streptomyces asoensis]QJS99509.1 MarR family transcriptional regulator [Streptomyces asoensis]